MTLGTHCLSAGLFSHINFLISHIHEVGHANFYVDWSEGSPYDQDDRINIYDQIFEQNCRPQNNDPIIRKWPHYRFTGGNADNLYRFDQTWRLELNDCWRMLRVKPEISNMVGCFSRDWGPDIIGLHVRNSNIAVECPGGVAPLLDQYAEALKGHDGIVFLATDNIEAVQFFQKHLSDRVVFRTIPRASSMQEEFHTSYKQTSADVANCLIDAMLLAKCSHLIHGVSNLATCVLYINPTMTHTYVTGENSWPQSAIGISDNDKYCLRVATMESAFDVIFVRSRFWSDWILIYSNNVIKRHSTGALGFWNKSKCGHIHLLWTNGGVETITPMIPSFGVDISGLGAIYYRRKESYRIVTWLQGDLLHRLRVFCFGKLLAKLLPADLIVATRPGDPSGLEIFGISPEEHPPFEFHTIEWEPPYVDGLELEIIREVSNLDCDSVWLRQEGPEIWTLGMIRDEIVKFLWKPTPLHQIRIEGFPVAVLSCGCAKIDSSKLAEKILETKDQIPNAVFYFYNQDEDLFGKLKPDFDIVFMPTMNEAELLCSLQSCLLFLGNSPYCYLADWLRKGWAEQTHSEIIS